MTRKFDLVVIGTGSAASAPAWRCRAAGWQVAVVDSRPFGGTCALRGCDPKKVLVGAAEVIDWNRRMQGKGIRPGQARIEWPELMRFKSSMIEQMPKHMENSRSKSGIAAFHGRARFVGPTAVQVGDDILDARNVVVASGAKPVDLTFPGHEHVIKSDQFLELKELPQRIVFIGGGYISFEFGHVAVRAGAGTVILHRGRRPLDRFDPDLVDQLVTKTRELGVDIQLRTEVKAVTASSGSFKVKASAPDEERVFEADMIVHGAGRVPEIDDMDLSKAGVDWDSQRGVKVNEYLQSVSNPAVYAAGDAAATEGAPLTPVASYEGQIVADNLLEGNHRIPNYAGVPSIVFTVPSLASVGLQQQAAQQRGLRFQTNHQTTSDWYSSRRVGEDCSGYKVLVEESSGHILGAHLLGPEAGETINLFALAIRRGLTAGDLKEMMFGYPTIGSDVPYML
jgi:glutathione reductase (NADPH)